MPTDVYEYETELSCDKSCSDLAQAVTTDDDHPVEDTDQHNMLWYKHILPQIRGRRFYGKTISEAIQSSGETIYAPNYMPHSVYNLDETVAVGDNPFFSTAIEESVFELYTNDHIGYGYMNESVAHIHRGLFRFLTTFL